MGLSNSMPKHSKNLPRTLHAQEIINGHFKIFSLALLLVEIGPQIAS